MARHTDDDESIDESPEGWTLIDDDPDHVQRLRVYQRRRDGLVIAIEEGVTQTRFCAAALPENYHDDDQVIRRYGDGGYIAEDDDRDAVETAAREWMSEHPR